MPNKTMTFEQEVELAMETFVHIREDHDFSQMFRMETPDEIVVGTMNEETADARATVLAALILSRRATRVVFMSDVWYSVVPKPSPAKEEWMKRTLAVDVMPKDDPERKEAFIVVVFLPTGFEIATMPYEMVDGKVKWEERLGGDEFYSHTFPRIVAALEIVQRLEERKKA